jgi:hypothetical protein
VAYWHAPQLTIPQILAWADAHFQRTGKWPIRDSGRISGALGATWCAIDSALVRCGRGLHVPGLSLARLLAEQRGARNHTSIPKLNVRQIIRWARAFHARTDDWPTQDSGPIPEAPGETWGNLDKSLAEGYRGLGTPETSLAQLLAVHCGVRNQMRLPRLTVRQILAWAAAHRKRTKRWPQKLSGPILESPGDTWLHVDEALRNGTRGLPAGSSLYRLLVRHHSVRRNQQFPDLKIAQIIEWAKEHLACFGTLPNKESGAIAGAGGQTWSATGTALQEGHRGLSGGTSLSQLLRKHFPRKHWPPTGRPRRAARSK